MDLKTKYYKDKINDFNFIIENFCNTEKIPVSFNNALRFRSKTGVGPFWYNLYKAPKVYLASSRSFYSYRQTLDNDFKNELLTDDEIYKIRSEIVKDRSLNDELKKIMCNDYGIGN